MSQPYKKHTAIHSILLHIVRNTERYFLWRLISNKWQAQPQVASSSLLKIEVGRLAEWDRMILDEHGRCRHYSISPACQFFHLKSHTLQISVNDMEFSCQRTYHLKAEHVSIKSPSKVHIFIFHRISDILQKLVNDMQYTCQCTYHFIAEHVSIKSPYKFHICIITCLGVPEATVGCAWCCCCCFYGCCRCYC